MQTATDTQKAHIADLTAKMLGSMTQGTADPARPLVLTGEHAKIRAAALALSLHEAATSADASAQIDALKSAGAGLMTYARANRDWAALVLDRLTSAWGRDYSGRPASITAAELATLAGGAA